MSAEVQQYYYVDTFLLRAKYALVHDQGAQKRTQANGVGPTLRFTRMTPLSTVTSSLTQGTNPAIVNITEANVDVTLAEYGNAIQINNFLTLTSIDRNNAEKISLLGQNMGETIDQLVRDEMFTNFTVQYANARAALANVVAGDNMTTTEIRKAVRTLKNNKAIPYQDGYFIAKFSPYTTFDLMADSVWVNAHTYKDGAELYQGEVGKIFQARVIESANPKSEASTVTVYSNFIHGEQAIGTYDLENDMPKLYIKISGDQDTSNPANRYSTAAWAGSYAAKTLNANWGINIKSAASA